MGIRTEFQELYENYKRANTYDEMIESYNKLVSGAITNSEIEICDEEAKFLYILDNTYLLYENFCPCFTPEQIEEQNLVSEENKIWFENYKETRDAGPDYDKIIQEIYKKYLNGDSNAVNELLSYGWDPSLRPTFINLCKVSRIVNGDKPKLKIIVV